MASIAIRRSWAKITTMGVLGSLLSISVIGPTNAGNFGAGATNETFRCINVGSQQPEEWVSECTTEDKFLYVFVTETVAAWFSNEIFASIYEDYKPISDFEAFYLPTYASNTDVYVRTASISNQDDYGFYTSCATFAQEGGGTGYYRYCDNQEILFDADHPFTTNVRDHSQLRREWAACHELGHTAGLSHLASNNPSRVTCMDYGHDTGNLHPHDVEHLNDCYPRPTSNQYNLTNACELYGV